MSKKLEDFVSEKQFTDMCIAKTKSILAIVAGGEENEARAMRVQAAGKDADLDEEAAIMLTEAVSGQAALFQAMSATVDGMVKAGMCDSAVGAKFEQVLRALNAHIIAHTGKAPVPSGENVIPFPAGGKGSSKLH